ncbi:hypothetical protein D3C76_1213260 [compost metagenome]
MKKAPESFKAEEAHPEPELLDEAAEGRLLLSKDLPPGLLRKAKDALALKYGAATTSTGGSLRSLRRWLAKCKAKRGDV